MVHEQMKYNQDSRQIIDDQNLIIGQMEDEEEEEEAYEEEAEEEEAEEEEDEGVLQQLQQQMEEEIDFDNIDPELLEAAQKLGLNEEGILALQR